MTTLVIMNETASETLGSYSGTPEISDLLASAGVLYQRWPTPASLKPDANQEQILSAYHKEIDLLNIDYGFTTTDVVSLTPEHPDKAKFREKFLAEHTHADFEVRFFVDGNGLFYLHIDDKVYLLFCERGDLLSVPADTTHWFDMGLHPAFKCIRFFTSTDGWVGHFTGNPIAKAFPDYESFVRLYR